MNAPAAPGPAADRPFDHRSALTAMPHLPGVYRMIDAAGAVLYVGKAKDLRKRVGSYFTRSVSPRIGLMVARIRSIDITTTPSEADALLLENHLIKEHAPPFNILFRDDKSYPFLRFSDHAFPRISVYRGPTDRRARYFGPFPGGLAVRDTVKLLQKVFQLRTCEDSFYAHRTRPCLLHQIRLCLGPCVGKVDEATYGAAVEQAVVFLRGGENVVEKELERRMRAASVAREYEQAALYRDRLSALGRIRHRQTVEVAGSDIDVDILAPAVEEGVACVNLAMVRGGRHLGDKAYFPGSGMGAAIGGAPDEAELVEAFASQHYVDQAPPGLLLVDAPVDAKQLAAALARDGAAPPRIVLAGSAAARAQRRTWIEMARANARIALARRRAEQGSAQANTLALIDTLGLDVADPALLRVDCFDVSHTQGEATQAACVVYAENDMRSKFYRRYNIRDVAPGDDYAAMRQALSRHYAPVARGEAPMPGLVLVDGGAGQVGVAREVFQELGLDESLIVGVAKGEERRLGEEELVFADGRPSLHLGLHSPALMLIARIRDEAHRFAITGMRARRARTRSVSRLEDLPAIGPRRRQRLLARFGGLRGLEGASIDDIAQVQGISRALAERIHGFLHGNTASNEQAAGGEGHGAA